MPRRRPVGPRNTRAINARRAAGSSRTAATCARAKSRRAGVVAIAVTRDRASAPSESNENVGRQTLAVLPGAVAGHEANIDLWLGGRSLARAMTAGPARRASFCAVARAEPSPQDGRSATGRRERRSDAALSRAKRRASKEASDRLAATWTRSMRSGATASSPCRMRLSRLPRLPRPPRRRRRLHGSVAARPISTRSSPKPPNSASRPGPPRSRRGRLRRCIAGVGHLQRRDPRRSASRCRSHLRSGRRRLHPLPRRRHRSRGSCRGRRPPFSASLPEAPSRVTVVLGTFELVVADPSGEVVSVPVLPARRRRLHRHLTLRSAGPAPI